MALSDSEKENFCPKVFPPLLKTDLGGIAGVVSLILLMPPGDLEMEIIFLIYQGWGVSQIQYRKIRPFCISKLYLGPIFLVFFTNVICILSTESVS